MILKFNLFFNFVYFLLSSNLNNKTLAIKYPAFKFDFANQVFLNDNHLNQFMEACLLELDLNHNAFDNLYCYLINLLRIL